MLSRLAYRLAKGLGPDRHKVPNTFRDVKHQLLAMGNALSFCWFQEDEEHHGDFNQGGSAKTEIDPTLAEMLSNCQASLQRLERLMSKYSCLDKEDNHPSSNAETPKPSAFKNAKKNWRKVLFLLEENELETIRKDIAIHIEAISMAVSGRIQSVFPALARYLHINMYC